jgi:hypothetical protein
MEGERTMLLRRTVLFGVPFLYVGALVLTTIGRTVFGLGHARPVGPVGMALFPAGIVWVELRPRREIAGEATSLQGARR